MGENHLYEQHVRDGITNGLIDEIVQVQQVGEGGQLGGDLWLMLAQFFLRLWGEQDGSVAIRFKINPNIVMFCSVVKVFDSSWNAPDWQALA